MLNKVFFNKRSLLNRLILSYMFLIVLPALTIGIISYKTFETAIIKQMSDSHTNEIKQISSNIGNMVDNVISVVSIYNFNADLEKLLNTEVADPEERLRNVFSGESKMKLYAFALNKLKHQINLLGANGVTYYINSDGINEQSVSISIETLSQNKWYKGLMENEQRITWVNTHPPISPSKSITQVFTAAKVLRNFYTNQLYGILLVSIDESSLYEIYAQSLTNASEILIIDTNGNIISDSAREKIGSKIDDKILGQIRLESQNKVVTSELNNKKILYTYEKIDMTDWYIVKIVPLSVLLEDSKLLGLKIAFISFFSIILSIIFAVLISRKISMPLIKLSKRIKDFAAPLHVLNKESRINDEVAILTSEYDNIITRLESTISNLITEQEKKRKAELEALQMQIKPHFLYNTLNSLKCLVWTNKIELIEPTIIALVRLLRQTININEFVTVNEEFEIIKNYIYIHQIRTDSLIEVNYWMDDSVTEYKIPKLIMLPIVENAIFHGLEPKGSKGKISILCKSDGDNLLIEVFDDGIGIENSKIEHLLTENTNDSKNQFSGIGLKNIDERLKIYYGRNYSFTIESKLNLGTIVTVKLPKK